jgi:hypothetical protein
MDRCCLGKDQPEIKLAHYHKGRIIDAYKPEAYTHRGWPSEAKITSTVGGGHFMNSRQKRITSAIALFLVFSTTQIYVSVSFAEPQPLPVLSATAPAVPPQQITGSLMTQGNKLITVNGVSATSGATVVSGASIETPDAVGGTVSLGSLGTLQIDPNTKLTLQFQNGSVKVMLLQGCVILHTKKGTTGEVDTSQGAAGKSDSAVDGLVKTCAPGSVATVPATAAGRGGLGTAATVAIIAGGATAVLVPILSRGTNSSPSTPVQ